MVFFRQWNTVIHHVVKFVIEGAQKWWKTSPMVWKLVKVGYHYKDKNWVTLYKLYNITQVLSICKNKILDEFVTHYS